MKFQVFGDSHSRFFELTPKFRYEFPEYSGVDVSLKAISGASISGLLKNKSTLNLRNTILDSIDQKCYAHVFAFGQVDIELNLYYRIFVKNEAVPSDYLERLANDYVCFVSSMSLRNPVIKGCNLSVMKYPKFAATYVSRILSNDMLSDQKQGLLKTINSELPSYVARNKDLINFNFLLKNACVLKGVKYFDVINSITNETGSVSTEFMPSGFDHHLADTLRLRKIHVDSLIYNS